MSLLFNIYSGSNSPQLAARFYKGCRLVILRRLLRGSSFDNFILSYREERFCQAHRYINFRNFSETY